MKSLFLLVLVWCGVFLYKDFFLENNLGKDKLILTHTSLNDENKLIKPIITCEQEIFEKFENDENRVFFKRYEDSLKEEMSYKELRVERNKLIDYLKDSNNILFSKDLFINFRGATMPYYDFIIYDRFCKTQQEHIKQVLLTASILGIHAFVFLILMMLGVFPEKKSKMTE